MIAATPIKFQHLIYLRPILVLGLPDIFHMKRHSRGTISAAQSFGSSTACSNARFVMAMPHASLHPCILERYTIVTRAGKPISLPIKKF
jgi:hypothetical protein